MNWFNYITSPIRKEFCMKKYTLYILSLFLLALTSCSSNTSEVADVKPAATVFQVDDNATAKKISKELNATPSSKEKNKNSGISAETYEKNTFAGYEGQISFFYNEDGSVLYYKWYINETDSQKATTIYEDICTALTGSYGEGIENNSESADLYTTSWETEKEQITAQKISSDSGYEISYTVVNK